jgi:hypothetical protein
MDYWIPTENKLNRKLSAFSNKVNNQQFSRKSKTVENVKFVRHFVENNLDFPKSSLFNFYLIAFGGVFNSTHFGDSLHTILFENSLKNCLTYDVISNAYAFFFKNKFFSIFFSYCRMCQYRRICQYRRNFLAKNFRRYCLPPYFYLLFF